MKKIIIDTLAAILGIFLAVYFSKFLYLPFAILDKAFLTFFLGLFFNLKVENFEIQIDNYFFIIDESCTIIKPFLIVFPLLLINKQRKILNFLILLIFLNFFRQALEVFLVVTFDFKTYIFSDLQNVFLPYLIIFFQLLKDYSTMKVDSN